MVAAQESPSKEVALESNKGIFDDAQLGTLKTMDDALSALGSVVSEIEDFSAYGSGFDILDNKDQLIGVPFVIVEWRFTQSKQFGGTFVSALVMDEQNRKFVVNDGSTGICQQLQMVTDQRIAAGKPFAQAGIIARKGLRRSDYTVESEVNGKTVQIEASTYYIA